MTEKFRNKYRTTTIRASWWDYGENGAYFITICTDQRKKYFGEISDGKIKLSNVGVLADVFWHEIQNHAKDVQLGQFVVMPNHIHCILIINKDHNKNMVNNDENNIGITDIMDKIQPKSRFQNQGKNTISSIIGSYKSAITKHSNRLGFEFKWQSRFYDHIIRNEEEYIRICEYIENNPKKWEEDKLFQEVINL